MLVTQPDCLFSLPDAAGSQTWHREEYFAMHFAFLTEYNRECQPKDVLQYKLLFSLNVIENVDLPGRTATASEKTKNATK